MLTGCGSTRGSAVHEPYLGSSSVRLIRSSEKARPVAERNSSLPSPPLQSTCCPPLRTQSGAFGPGACRPCAVLEPPFTAGAIVTPLGRTCLSDDRGFLSHGTNCTLQSDKHNVPLSCSATTIVAAGREGRGKGGVPRFCSQC